MKEELLESMQKGAFSMRILYEQFANIQKMGPVGQIMGMIPGLSNAGVKARASLPPPPSPLPGCSPPLLLAAPRCGRAAAPVRSRRCLRQAVRSLLPSSGLSGALGTMRAPTPGSRTAARARRTRAARASSASCA